LGSTVFVDHASDFSYIFHHTALNSIQTVHAKQAFETEARHYGISIKHCCADNGLFCTKHFFQDLKCNGQTISLAGVGAHHQNGIAEERIGDLQQKATMLILHAQQQWPDAINAHLWPYAICCANETRNICPTRSNPLSPLNHFCNSTKKLSYANQHHFGCPVYVLTKDIQERKKARKWTDRTHIGVNLGPSPRHASSVSLILNIHTELVSPQFCCQYDNLFESTTGCQAQFMPRSQWQFLSSFSHEGDQNSPLSSEPTKVTNINILPTQEMESSSTNSTLITSVVDPLPQYRTKSGRLSKPPNGQCSKRSKLF
jgi:hypothetical protein